VRILIAVLQYQGKVYWPDLLVPANRRGIRATRTLFRRRAEMGTSSRLESPGGSSGGLATRARCHRIFVVAIGKVFFSFVT
jgi:hypothetical protein